MIARGWAGPSLLAMILFEKFGQHQPLSSPAPTAADSAPLPCIASLPQQK
jgi:transposase